MLLFAAACDGRDGLDPTGSAYSLGDVDTLYVGVHVTSEPTGAQVKVYVGGESFVQDCIEVDDSFSVHVDGQPADPTALHHGNADVDECDQPWATVAVPSERRLLGRHVVVADRTRTATVSLGDALIPRSARWVVPADGVVRAGDRFEIEWSPAADLGGYGRVFFANQTAAPFQPTVDARTGRLSGTVPPIASDGATRLDVTWYGGAGAAPCDAARCTVRVDSHVTLDATVTR